MLDYDSIAAICKAAEEKQITISALALSDQAEQMELPEEELYERMEKSLHVMQEAVKQGMDPELRSTSGLTGGDAAKVEAYAETGGITGKFLNRAMARAVPYPSTMPPWERSWLRPLPVPAVFCRVL